VWQECFETAFRKAVAVLPTVRAVATKPWISSRTLIVIDERNAAQANGDQNGVARLTRKVRACAKDDRRQWLDHLVESGEWNRVRALRKGFAPKPSKLKDLDGHVVDNTQRAETMAEYYEKVQWRVRPDDVRRDDGPIGEELFMDLGAITHGEVTEAAKALKKNRACGADQVPAEFWQAILATDSEAGRWATEFCNTCWTQTAVPMQWHLARVAAIFKKGAHDDPANYRPISLLCVVYKLFTSILLRRLKAAGAENRIWSTQFGFKSLTGTRDALFLARRMIEAAWDAADGKLMLLALDWAKAFDSVSPAALSNALRRFGLPVHFVSMVEKIYEDRKFFVSECGTSSSPRDQAFGISQGCPLSPFLFVIMMSVLMHDANRKVLDKFGAPSVPYLVTRSLLYADDTLIIESDEKVVQYFMECIAEIGGQYGMEFNWGKLEVLRVRHGGHVMMADGSLVKEKDTMLYLGSQLASDGRVQAELSRRLGMAAADFRVLERVWAHASIPRKRKIAIYKACVVQKLMYSLDTAWLCAEERRKLDGFHARCLRRICKIQHSYWSHISNAEVLQTAGEQPLSSTLKFRQLKLFGRIARMDGANCLRQVAFEDGSCGVRRWHGLRRQGRPRQTWAPCVRAEAVKAAGGEEAMARLLQNSAEACQAWARAIGAHCFRGT